MRKNYNHPQVQTVPFVTEPLLQIISPNPSAASGTGQVNPGIPADEQW